METETHSGSKNLSKSKRDIVNSEESLKKSKKSKKDRKRKHSSSSDHSENEHSKSKRKKKCKKRHKHNKEKLHKQKVKDKYKNKEKHCEKSKPNKDEEEVLVGPEIPEVLDKSKSMAPMSKEEWDKRQKVTRRVFDEDTGRTRLIKGDGEVLEEIVSRERHQEINRQATVADGNFFQSKLKSWVKK